MADATLQILGLGSKAVPLDYNVTGNQDLDLIAVKADFDGTSALVDFVPVVEILSDADHVMAQSKGPTVTAGGSATVTFAPFLSNLDASSASAVTVPQYMTHSGLCPPNASGSGVFTTAFGPAFFDDLGGSLTPACLVAGTYTLLFTIQGSGAAWPVGSHFIAQSTTNVTTGGGYLYSTYYGPVGAAISFPTVTLATADNFAVGDTFQMDYFNGSPAPARTLGGQLLIVAQ